MTSFDVDPRRHTAERGKAYGPNRILADDLQLGLQLGVVASGEVERERFLVGVERGQILLSSPEHLLDLQGEPVPRIDVGPERIRHDSLLPLLGTPGFWVGLRRGRLQGESVA